LSTQEANKFKEQVSLYSIYMERYILKYTLDIRNKFKKGFNIYYEK